MMFWGSKTGISSKYSFSSSPTFSSEPWSVYTGRPKSTSSTAGPNRVSIFMFDKKIYESYLLHYGIIKSKSSTNDKKIIQEGYDILRNQVNNLAKLKHPNVLTLIEPLEEHSKNFLFVTEYVTGSLETVFVKKDDEQSFLKGHVKDDVIIHRGIFQLVHALDFIHNRAGSVHLDIQPRSIFINDNSDWKISGLGHLMKIPDGSNSTEYFMPQYDPRIPSFMQLPLDFTAPEIVLDSTVSIKSDFFSLGMLMYLLYAGDSLFRTENSTSQYKDEYAKLERKISTMSWENVFSKLPPRLRQCIPMLMNRDIFSRYDNITDFLASEFFQDPIIKTLNFLDDLPTKSNEDKLVFLEGLDELLPQFPESLLQRKFLAVLLDLLNQLCAERNVNSRCVTLNLGLVIKISGTLSQLSFQERLLPVMTNKTNFPILMKHATTSLIENLPILKEKVKLQDFLDVLLKPILTYVLNEMEGDAAVVPQEKLLDQMELILDCLDFLTVKKFLLPLLSQLFTKTTSLKVKIICVKSFQTLVERKTVDTYICCDEILPLFKSMKSRDPRILLKSLSFFETLPQVVVDESALVGQLLPLLWNYSMADTLDSTQYNNYTKVINNISFDIQKNHADQLQKTKTTNTGSSGNEFKKMIENNSNEYINREAAQDAAKSVSTPTINPVRKPSERKPASTQSRISVTSATTSTTGGMPPKKSIPTPLNRSTSNTFTSPSNNNSTRSITNSNSNTNTNSNFDDFDDFVTASPTASIATNPVSTNQQDTTPFRSNTTSSSSIPIQNSLNSSFPPGFSVSLQPNKKLSNSMNPMQQTSNSNLSDSLI
ncbi:hypothetical protein Kpol_1002p61 [Vanderwaltozyma polyspora DSM 70294]|uniref:Protein kinase domain-containing protein n=1 Tax=Vanderwaltozyma polyspora (strain ATCC 22028 / DSM 70294 / BCRC 21397 / CBS 2163 / NBRC 10782 / NRRL Y-8283 / UCD 57-17) TaxID=436907 RepID=A7TE92_VANPO|nr:uncharacterized protein Kpol_1002p61 [Vanderwaltozyma polyspora DSM 70294]EDO19414.1 hypothetical protein Kpol_1002p61 [Vanderwaltozyma polyspora DSM 70294]